MFKRFDMTNSTTIINLSNVVYIDLNESKIIFYTDTGHMDIKFSSPNEAMAVYDEIWRYVK